MTWLKVTIAYTLVGALAFAAVFAVVPTTYAQPAYTINYQGKLTDATGLAVADGDYDMEFKLYAVSSGGTAVWTETRTGGNQVSVVNGLFSVMLGDVTPLTSVDFNQPLWLGVNIESDGEMTPRKALGTVPSAFEAQRVGGVASSSFLRSDEADTASGLLTFTGGLVSTASSTINSLTTDIATTTTFVINGEAFTDLTGAGLLNNSGVFTIDTAFLDPRYASTTDFDTSAELAAILADETGTGSVVFSNSPTFTGTVSGAAASFSGNISAGSFTENGTTLSGQYFKQGGNSYGSLATLGTNDANDLTFETNNARRMTIDASGNVGIGTTSPTLAKFVVNTASGANGIALQSPSINSPFLTWDNGTQKFSARSNDDSWVFGSGDTSTFNSLFTIRNNGNVGIGTNNPLAKLQVQQYNTGISFTPNARTAAIFEGSANGTVVQLVAPTGTTQNEIWFGTPSNQSQGRVRYEMDTDNLQFYTASSEKLRITSTGNVGIGTTNPTSKLTFGTAGDTISMDTIDGSDSKYLYIAGGGSASVNRGASMRFFGNESPSNPGALQLYAGNVNANISFGVSGTGNYIFENTGVGGNIGLGTSTPGARLDILADNDSTSSYALRVIDENTFADRFHLVSQGGGNDTPIDMYVSGNVGIGTTAPDGPLTISEGVTNVKTKIDDNSISFSRASDGGYQGSISFNAVDTMTYGSRGPHRFTSNGAEVLTVLTNGNVGIGTASPGAKLDISAGTNLNLGVSQLAHASYVNEGIGLTFTRTTSDSDLMGIGVVDSDKLGLFSRQGIIFGTGGSGGYDATTEVMRIVGAGNVGIGTTNPSVFKLQVAGNVGPETDSTYNLGSAIRRWATVYAGSIDATSITENGTTLSGQYFKQGGNSFATLATLGTNDVNDLTFETNNTRRMTIDTSGNVGIGDTAPGNKLDVAGNINIAAGNAYRIGDSDILKYNATSKSLAVGDGAGSLFNDTGTQNTAIGYQAGYESGTATTQDFLTAIGGQAGWRSTGDNLVAMGYRAGYTNTGDSVSVVGLQAGFSNSGSNLSAFGLSSAYQNTGTNVSAFGVSSAYQNTGSSVSAFGVSSAYQNTAANVSAFGQDTFRYRNAANSVAVGYQAGYGSNAVRGSISNSTFVGYRAGYGITTGSNNLLLGYQAGDALTSGSNNIAIGYDVDLPSATASNQLNIGNAIYGNLSTGNIGIGASNPGVKLSLGVTTENSAGSKISVFDNSGLNIYGIGLAKASNFGLGLYANNNSTEAPRMFIESTGNVGIGTTAPASTLHVYGQTTLQSSLTTNTLSPLTANTLGNPILSVVNRAASGNYGGMHLYTGGQTSGTYIASSGASKGAWSAGASFFSGNTWRASETVGSALVQDNGVLTYNVNMAQTVGATAAMTELFRINSDGKVGIGTSSPSALLHLQQAANTYTPALSVQGGDNILTVNTDLPGTDITESFVTVGGTFPATHVGNVYGVYERFVSNGSSTRQQVAHRIQLDQGYEGNKPTTALEVANNTSPTGGVAIGISSSMDGGTNTGSGANDLSRGVGMYSLAKGPVDETVGVWGTSALNSNVSALRIGVAGFAKYATTANIGGYFALHADGFVKDLTPTAFTAAQVSSALVATNGTEAANIFTGYDNTTPVFSIVDGGNVGIGTTTPSSRLTVSGDGYITGGLGVGKTNTTAGSVDITGKYLVNGTQAIYSPGGDTIFVGDGGGSLNQSGGLAGQQNAAIGFRALQSITTGYRNVAIGYQSGQDISDGNSNVTIGYTAGANITSGTNNLVMGAIAGNGLNTGSSNVILGNQALYGADATRNVGIGDTAGRYVGATGSTLFTSGNDNIIIGSLARFSADGVTNEIVIGKSAVGNGSNSVTLGADTITKTILKGNVGIGDATPAALLTVGNGDLFQVNSSGLALAQAGSVSAPAFSFAGDSDTGMYRRTLGELNFAVDGSWIGTFTTSGLGIYSGQGIFNRNGTAALPSYTFGGDTDTGMYTSAANTLAFTTAGSQRMIIDSDGDVGIGVTNPSYALQVHTTGNNMALFQGLNPNVIINGTSDGGGRAFAFQNAGTTKASILNTGSNSNLYFNADTQYFRPLEGGQAYLSLAASGSGNAAVLKMLNRNTAATTVQIDALGNSYFNTGGNFGIGTNAPDTKLTVKDDSNLQLRLVSGSEIGIVGVTTTGSLDLWAHGDNVTDTIRFLTGTGSGTERMRVSNTGRVSIGTTSTTGVLNLYTNTGAVPSFFLQTDNASSPAIRFKYRGNPGDGDWSLNPFINGVSNNGLSFVDNDGGTTPFVISGAGNVGIGTTSPASKLTVNGDAYVQGGISSGMVPYSIGGTLALNRVGGDSGIIFHENGVQVGQLRGDGDNNLIQFSNSGATSFPLTINLTNGNVGIGTTNPNYKLSVSNAGNGGFEVAPDYNPGATALLTYDRIAGVYDRMDLMASSIKFFTNNGTARVEIDANGHLNPATNGAYNLGTASLAWGCLYYNSGTLGTCASDERLKSDIDTLSFATGSTTALDKLALLDLRSFEYNSAPGSKYHGLIAQEVRAAGLEALVTEADDGYLAVRYGDLQWVVIEAMQDMWKRVQEYFDRTEALEEEVEDLKQRIEDLERGSGGSTTSSSGGGNDSGDSDSSSESSGDESGTTTPPVESAIDSDGGETGSSTPPTEETEPTPEPEPEPQEDPEPEPSASEGGDNPASDQTI